MSSMMIEAELRLTSFLDECSAGALSLAILRVPCPGCHFPRPMYCFDCCRIVIPRDRWPTHLQEKSLRLPFELDIILDDRRSSATGVQFMAVVNSMAINDASENNLHMRDDPQNSVRLFDVPRGDPLPEYGSDYEGATFLLFPSRDSIPLSHAVTQQNIKRLVVLDCTWSKTKIRLAPSLAKLPKIHLDKVPSESLYWRWHNAGNGMLSTIEAIFYCAWEVASANQQWSLEDRDKLVYYLWLFTLKREVIRQKYDRGEVQIFYHGHQLPFTKEGKEVHRQLRMKQRQKRAVIDSDKMGK